MRLTPDVFSNVIIINLLAMDTVSICNSLIPKVLNNYKSWSTESSRWLLVTWPAWVLWSSRTRSRRSVMMSDTSRYTSDASFMYSAYSNGATNLPFKGFQNDISIS